MARVKLGEVARECKETCKGSKKGLRAVGLEHLEPENIALTQWDTRSDNTFTKLFYEGQMLFGRRRAYLKKAAMASFDGICSGDITVIEANPERLLPTLMPFIIQSNTFFDFAVEGSAGSLSPRVKWEYLSQYEFELPPLEEQAKLAEVLWAFEKTKSAYKMLLTSTEDLVQAQFVEMFGELGLNEYGWEMTTLGQCCTINPKRSDNIALDDNMLVSFVAMPSVSEKGDIDTAVLRSYKEVKKGFTYFAENDVLFAKITPCMENGKGAIAHKLKNGIGFGSTEFHVLRPDRDKVDSRWIYEITMLKKFRKSAELFMTGTGGQRRVSASFLNNFPVALPPLTLQKIFSDFAMSVHSSASIIQQSLSTLDQARNALMEKTFR